MYPGAKFSAERPISDAIWSRSAAFASIRACSRFSPLVQRREDQTTNLLCTLTEQRVDLQRVQSHGIVDPMPLDGSDRQVRHLTCPATSNNLAGSQAFIL